MNVIRYINELRVQRENIDEAIASLSRLGSLTPRRGRPPKYVGSAAPDRKYVRSAETRKRMSVAQKRRWAS